MSNTAATPTIIPTMRYADARAAIDWLCSAFGFEKKMVVDGDGGAVAHAELTHGNGMIMLGSATEDAWGKLVQAPTGGTTTQSAYVIVDDVASHYQRAKAAGAEIVRELTDEGHGHGYGCRDPQGHVWYFGDYDPWSPTGA